jgi:thiamine-phosphate pyrophosphorylase
MPRRTLLYYITDRSQFPGPENERRHRLLASIAEATRCGVDFIQLREKDLSARELEMLASEAITLIREHSGANSFVSTRLLINSRLDVAMAVRASGVHLRSDDISVADARAALTATGFADQFLIAQSCHTVEEVRQAALEKASFVVFGPVFEKQDVPQAAPSGLQALADACRVGIPVFALGGVTPANATSCVAAGARGIAGIRLFQHGSIRETAKQLRDG